MERVLIPGESVTLPYAEDAPARARGLLVRIAPLWRHAVWLVAFAAVLSVAVAVRLDVQRVRKDYERTLRTQREALILQDRLRLELDARRRATAMEDLANRYQLVADPRVVDLSGEK